MGGCEIDIRKITGSKKTVNIYRPVVDDASHPYGLAEHWVIFAECPMWKSETSMSSYGGEAGIAADTTTAVYIGGKGRDPSGRDGIELPSRVGLQFDEDDDIVPSASVENFFDFDGSYVYSVVII